MEYLHSFFYEMVVYYTYTSNANCSLFMPKVQINMAGHHNLWFRKLFGICNISTKHNYLTDCIARENRRVTMKIIDGHAHACGMF